MTPLWGLRPWRTEHAFDFGDDVFYVLHWPVDSQHGIRIKVRTAKCQEVEISQLCADDLREFGKWLTDLSVIIEANWKYNDAL